MEWILGGFLIATAISVLVRLAVHRWTVVTPDEITASLNAAGVTEWYSVGVEDRQGTVTALVGVTVLTDDVRRRVREALSPIPVELHHGDRPPRS